jgi:zinc transport system substrate-binding protein
MAGWRLLRVLALVLVLLPACSRREAPVIPGRLQVVTTLFPLYDFVRVVGGDKVQASLLLPPGVEPHSFEPKPEDIVRISKADLFVYTSPVMEPWASKLLTGIAGGKLQPVVAGARATYLGKAAGHDHDDHEGHDHDSGQDPHIWLDLGNAALMVDTIAAGLAGKDPANREFYLANAAAYKGQLTALDNRFRQGLSSCRTREFLSGGHFAFFYLARRYDLTYHSAYGISADAEPTAKTMMQLVQQLRAQRLRTIFTEELLSPRLAETIARETGAAILPLHGLHNLSKEELAGGATFLSLMEENLKNLRTGLECR